jgi:hypothetical protein
MKQLEVINTYNYMLYLTHYMPHLEQLETLRNGGDIMDMSTLEATHLMPGNDTDMEANQEIGNWQPSSQIEDGIYTRIIT